MIGVENSHSVRDQSCRRRARDSLLNGVRCRISTKSQGPVRALQHYFRFHFVLITALDRGKELAQIPCVTHSTLTSKNQTTIPKAVVEALKLRPSDQLIYEIEADGRVILSAKTGTFASVAAGLARKPSAHPARSDDEIKAAVKSMARQRWSRTKP